MNAKKLELYTKMIEIRTLLRIWEDNLSVCTDTDLIHEQIIHDMETYAMNIEHLFEGVMCETRTYFIKELIARCVVNMDREEDLELSDFGHMFILNTLYKRFENHTEVKTTDWHDTICGQMENITNGEGLN